VFRAVGLIDGDYVAFIGIYKFQYLLDPPLYCFLEKLRNSVCIKTVVGWSFQSIGFAESNTEKMTTVLNTNRCAIVSTHIPARTKRRSKRRSERPDSSYVTSR